MKFRLADVLRNWKDVVSQSSPVLLRGPVCSVQLQYIRQLAEAMQTGDSDAI